MKKIFGILLAFLMPLGTFAAEESAQAAAGQEEAENVIAAEESVQTAAGQEGAENFLTTNYENIKISSDGVSIENMSVEEIQKVFDNLSYDRPVNPKGNLYPRIFIQNIPSDFALLKDRNYRNDFFIQMLMPIVLKVNQEVLEERQNLEILGYAIEYEKDFQKIDTEYIDQLAKKYEVETPFKDTRRYIRLLNELKRRVDAVPPSILVSAAAIYTDWGTSRLAVEGRNLYKAKVWFTDEGLKPMDENEDDSYRYKIYPSLEESVRDYVLKINRGINYEAFWKARELARQRKGYVFGKRMDWGMLLDNQLQNYAGLLDYTLTYYKFEYLDMAKLENEYALDD